MAERIDVIHAGLAGNENRVVTDLRHSASRQCFAPMYHTKATGRKIAPYNKLTGRI